MQFGASEFLKQFALIRGDLPAHAATNMPGKVLLFYFLEIFTNSPSIMGLVIMTLSNLGGVFLYFCILNVFNDKKIALYSMILYFLVPGKIYFFPILNTVSPALILLCFLLFIRFWSTLAGVWAVALGLALYLLTLFEPLPLAMGLLFAVFAAAFWKKQACSWRAAGRLVFGVLAGFGLTYGVVKILFGYNLLENLLYVLWDAREFNYRRNRSYDIWFFLNLIEFSLAVGVSMMATAPLALLQSRGQDTQRCTWISQPIVLWATSIIVVLFVLDVVGINRGEVIRLWVFLACFFTVIPAHLFAQSDSKFPFALFTCGLLIETAVGVGMVAFVIP
jgi:hypothetical protein